MEKNFMAPSTPEEMRKTPAPLSAPPLQNTGSAVKVARNKHPNPNLGRVPGPSPKADDLMKIKGMPGSGEVSIVDLDRFSFLVKAGWTVREVSVKVVLPPEGSIERSYITDGKALWEHVGGGYMEPTLNKSALCDTGSFSGEDTLPVEVDQIPKRKKPGPKPGQKKKKEESEGSSA